MSCNFKYLFNVVVSSIIIFSFVLCQIQDVKTVTDALAGTSDIVFILDSSTAVGPAAFDAEKKIVEDVLTHIKVSKSTTRVSIITYGKRSEVVVDFFKNPENKCVLIDELNSVQYEDLGTKFMKSPMKKAVNVFKNSRKNVKKTIILLVLSDYKSRNSQPCPADDLREMGVEIFAFGTGVSSIQKLQKFTDKAENVFLFKTLKELLSYADKIKGDPEEVELVVEDVELCNNTCYTEAYKPCCDAQAECTCGLLSGRRQCVCKPGYFGITGLNGHCKPCPQNTFKETLTPELQCNPCPENSITQRESSTSISNCACIPHFAGHPTQRIPCERATCQDLEPPQNGKVEFSKGTGIGSIAVYSCRAGFELNDILQESRECTPDDWSGQEPHCQIVSCPELEDNEFFEDIRQRCNNTFRSVCDFVCPSEGQIIEPPESSTIECQEDGTWSSQVPICQGIPFHQVHQPHILVRKKRYTPFRLQVEFQDKEFHHFPRFLEEQIVEYRTLRRFPEFCTPGTFSETGLKPCTKCPKNHYQDEAQQKECKQCLDNEVTISDGATSISECQELCPSGTFRKDSNFEQCPIGTYQDESDALYCKICPPGTLTIDEGSKTKDQCLEFCTPGTFSETGLKPCTKCPKNHYQDEAQQKECKQCLDNEVTISDGATSISECQENCSPGHFSSTGIEPCKACPHNHFQDERGKTICKLCPNGTITDFEGATSEDECQDDLKTEECDIVCENGGTCVKSDYGEKSCACPPEFTGETCEIGIRINKNSYIITFKQGIITTTVTVPTILETTIGLWIQTNDTDHVGSILSYATKMNKTSKQILDNALTIADYGNKLYVNNQVITTGLQLNDGNWQHLTFSWSTDGTWKIFHNCSLSLSGMDFQAGNVIPGDGILVLGQEQDAIGGGFNPLETFIGNMTRFNMWNKVLSEEEVRKLCMLEDEDIQGLKILSWDQLANHTSGEFSVQAQGTFQIPVSVIEMRKPLSGEYKKNDTPVYVGETPTYKTMN